MKYSYQKYFISILLFVFMLIGHVAFSQAILDPKALSGMESQTSKLRDRAGYESTGETGVGNVVASVIQGFIALLGIIFVILIIYAGYNWMTAGGDEGVRLLV